MEALAGLASKENFSSVTLKPVTAEDMRELPPYTHPMLIRVKGRRHAQARLMDPLCHSVNAGDDFVLVTPEKVLRLLVFFFFFLGGGKFEILLGYWKI